MIQNFTKIMLSVKVILSAGMLRGEGGVNSSRSYSSNSSRSNLGCLGFCGWVVVAKSRHKDGCEKKKNSTTFFFFFSDR